MKLRSLALVSLSFLPQCRTPNMTDVSQQSILKADAPSDELILSLTVGGLPEDAKKPPLSDCRMRASEVKDISKVTALITSLETAEYFPAMHFRATEPSIEIYAYRRGKKITVYKDYSTLEVPSLKKAVAGAEPEIVRHPASLELLAILSQKCHLPENVGVAE